ncbi:MULTISPECIES: bifunctional diguanylate cyclase/phosphodiesterase [Nitrincola]|uniref:Cyclic di-GMP phosphodiesterase Gmr n=1 Tax=Nitrincola nitratireducens TaxID=1229521 RepID=W9VM02_9GAMM|nr:MULTISPECIES: EAL domain-containing protein [Nitrincola]EXJ11550.1 Cyclic di-GMP phosphodiesterase Gmr [Nitrincola nitratireducens]
MSLIKQLWIAVVVLMILAFISSFSISTYTAKAYFEEQLTLKNIDNANSLALTLSQLEKDPVTLELLIAAQFDTGHYNRIELIDPEGNSLQRKFYEGEVGSQIPGWFLGLAPLSIEPGVAQVQDGWHQFGTLYVESHTRYAYEALWATTRNLLFWLSAVALTCGLLGTFILKVITRPLDDVVTQAEAIGGRRFIMSDVPKTLEFGRVVRAMNILSSRIRQMLESEAQRLEALRYKYQHDPLTGVANREYFINLLDAHLGGVDSDSHHAMFLVRVHHLADINQALGHKHTDELLKQVASALRELTEQYTEQYSDGYIGRLNGSDFALLLSQASDLRLISAALETKLLDLSNQYETIRIMLPHAACYFTSQDKRATLFVHLDSMLAIAEQREKTCGEVSDVRQIDACFHSADEWRQALYQAVGHQGVRAVYYPVMSSENNLLQSEAMMRLELGGVVRNAGYFIPWARRLGMMPTLDLAMLNHVLSDEGVELKHHSIAVNMSVETLCDVGARQKVIEVLNAYPQQASQLWLEFPERSAILHLNVFKEFCAMARQTGCKLGLERAGADFAKIKSLQELGLDYIKIDSAFVRDLADGGSSEAFLRGLCTLGHSIGLLLIADGVQNQEEAKRLKEIGVDGITGPGVGSL